MNKQRSSSYVFAGKLFVVGQFCVTLAVLSGCNGRPDEQVQDADTSSVLSESPVVSEGEAEPAIITMDRGSCLGPCPVYAVSLMADGTVIYTGDLYVERTGSYRYSVAPEAVALLASRFRKEFFSLPDTIYFPPGSSCGEHMTDVSWIRIVLQNGIERRRVFADQGCSKSPRMLGRFAAAIDSVAQTSRLVKGR